VNPSGEGSPAPASSGRRRRTINTGWTAAAFLLPLLAFYAVYYVYSFVFLGQVSQQRVGLSFVDQIQVGFQNYQLVLTDPIFQRSIINNLIFAAVSIAA